MARTLKKLFVFGVVPLLLLGGVLAWFERDVLLNWYYLHRLKGARGDEVAVWAERTASRESAVVPCLLKLLTEDDETLCANAHAAIEALGQRWGKDDPRSGEMLEKAVMSFAKLSGPGQIAVMKLTDNWAECCDDCPECLVCAGSRLLAETQHLHKPALLGPSVELALTIVPRSKRPDLLCAATAIAQAALSSPDASVRARGLRLAVHAGIDLHKDAAKLLHDGDAMVRQAAMLAVAENSEVVPTDTLMAWLHDADAEVRRLCETALRGPNHGLKPHHIRLARLIGDKRWEVRLTVLDHLEDAQDLDPSGWLLRLTQDDSAPVRIAAVRYANDHSIDLRDRLTQMAERDPSPTVCDLARHYLSRHRR